MQHSKLQPPGPRSGRQEDSFYSCFLWKKLVSQAVHVTEHARRVLGPDQQNELSFPESPHLPAGLSGQQATQTRPRRIYSC